MNSKLRQHLAPLLILVAFFYTFYYFPRVKEEHFNILVLASVLTPFVVLLAARVSIYLGLIQATALQLVYTLYAAWYWQHRDALTEHYFSFENPLRIAMLVKLFLVSLVIASAVRLALEKLRELRIHH